MKAIVLTFLIIRRHRQKLFITKGFGKLHTENANLAFATQQLDVFHDVIFINHKISLHRINLTLRTKTNVEKKQG